MSDRPATMSTKDCTQVSALCPVEATVWGYYPNLPANAFLLAVFAVITLAQLLIALLRRGPWGYSLAIASGTALEALGYAGKLMMNANPWTDPGTKLQIVCLVLGPTLIAAAIYLSVKAAVVYNGASHSRLRPRLYVWIFVSCDVGSLCLQAVGGGVAASAGKDKPNTLKVGDDIIVTGIAFQVATMIVCGALAVEYALRWRKARAAEGREKVVVEGGDKEARNAVLFQGAVAFAFVTVLIRCIYRLPEMAGGWGNPRMRNEREFLLLDGMMIAFATISLTVFHPAFFFPSMRTGEVSKAARDTPQSSSADENNAAV